MMRALLVLAFVLGTAALAQRASRLIGPPELTGCYRVSAVNLDGGVYSRPRLCADSDGGIDPPPGLFLLYADGDGTTDYSCACASSAACLRVTEDGGTEAAPRNLTLQPGRWAGVCRPKTCVELAGRDSMPGACK